MIEGLWTITYASNVDVFRTGQGAVGSGVLIFETERIFGGDNRYFYLGKYTIKGNSVEAVVNVTHFTGDPIAVFGDLRRFDVVLTAELNDNEMNAIGYLLQDQNRKIVINLVKRSELP